MRFLYVDGGALDGAIERLKSSIGVTDIQFRYESFFSQFVPSRTFFFDALPVKKVGKSEPDFQIRRNGKEAFFSNLNRLSCVNVHYGTTRWSNKNRTEQKAVDVLLAVKVVSHALTGVTSSAVILTNDLDFCPIFDTLRDSKVITHLIFDPNKTNEELVEAADYATPLSVTKLLHGCEEKVAESIGPSPTVTQAH